MSPTKLQIALLKRLENESLMSYTSMKSWVFPSDQTYVRNRTIFSRAIDSYFSVYAVSPDGMYKIILNNEGKEFLQLLKRKETARINRAIIKRAEHLFHTKKKYLSVKGSK